MEDRIQRYVKSLDKTVQNNLNYLKETMKDFCEMCQIVSRKGTIPQQILVQVRQTHKEIQERLKEINAIQNLLQTKYRRFYSPDSRLDRKLNEIRFLAKTVHSKFEYEVQQIQRKNKEAVQSPTTGQEHLSLCATMDETLPRE